MIIPDNQIPPDDSENEEADDQRSQQDIHSNGFDEDLPLEVDDAGDTDKLEQAYDASEPSYTLDFGDDDDED